MMKHKSLGNYVPYPFFKFLFGNRKIFGKITNPNDPDWIEWEKKYLTFYDENQKKSVGKIVNDAGYDILKKIDFENKNILELGPGKINHFHLWNTLPNSYAIADINQDFLDCNDILFRDNKVNYSKHLINTKPKLPFESNSKDVIITFYQLEHLHPFENFLEEYLRVLKPNGVLVGAIPCEGGIGWGLGRFFTSRKWFKMNTTIDPDKIICWEHPNFADFILNSFRKRALKQHISFWPLRIRSIDFNLVVKFIFKKN